MYYYRISHYSGCNNCGGAMQYLETIASEEKWEELENPNVEVLLEAIDYGSEVECLNCGEVGDFTILKLEYSGKTYEVG